MAAKVNFLGEAPVFIAVGLNRRQWKTAVHLPKPSVCWRRMPLFQ